MLPSSSLICLLILSSSWSSNLLPHSLDFWVVFGNWGVPTEQYICITVLELANSHLHIQINGLGGSKTFFATSSFLKCETYMVVIVPNSHTHFSWLLVLFIQTISVLNPSKLWISLLIVSVPGKFFWRTWFSRYDGDELMVGLNV